MTTIISNGHYLIADHRRSGNENSSYRNLIGYHKDIRTNTSKLTRKKTIYVHKDIAEKFYFLEKPLPVGKKDHGSITHMVFCGKVEGTTAILRFIEHYMHDKHITDKSLTAIIPYLKMLSFTGSVGLFGITDTFYTEELKFVRNNNNLTTTHTSYSPGTMAIAGSGAGKVKALSIPIQKLHPREVFLIAQYLDPYTSPTYGVYGNQEKQYAPFVFEPEDKRSGEAKALILKYLQRNHNNTYKALVTAGDEGYDSETDFV